MEPPDEWVELLNFYLIVASAGELTMTDFEPARLAEAYQEYSGTESNRLSAIAEKLVLEFQAKAGDTEAKSPLGEIYLSPSMGEEQSDGPVSIHLPALPGDV